MELSRFLTTEALLAMDGFIGGSWWVMSWGPIFISALSLRVSSQLLLVSQTPWEYLQDICGEVRAAVTVKEHHHLLSFLEVLSEDPRD